ncbi:acyl-CoA thioesterase [Roseovarius spongiae]|uniref:Acyl-CoA thioesterase n=1 Tax=Roseovarius spongiae TaxID=2320272 RepID=A0A3A8AX11_9RHOB|nr:acyl-CoA thioesterase [Roseovarius spongiae]RKF16236.1 acyl-CoA thioesterase [Roseovarius spongiae]
MYPAIRMLWQLWKHRNDPALPVTGTHVSRHYCLPWDIDLWMELNNGRTLTLYDLGRIPLARRAGLIRVLRARKWGLTMAGASVRYRRRVRPFEAVEMRSRMVSWDERFVYIEQSMWKADGGCANHIVYRGAVTGKSGIVPPAEVLEAMGRANAPPPMPEWIAAWIAADAVRPWPPMQDATEGETPQE